MISMISSVGRNNELGKNNDLIWHFKEDMKYFKNTTMNHKVVMGYNTYKSLPGNLPGREIIVVTSKEIDDVETVNGIEPIVEKYAGCDEEIFICGGASIYRQFLPYANRLYLTEIDSEDKNADTFFPEFNRKEWERTLLSEYQRDDIAFKMYLYKRK